MRIIRRLHIVQTKPSASTGLSMDDQGLNPAPGDTVTITGTFPVTEGVVRYGGVLVPHNSWSTTAIEVTWPNIPFNTNFLGIGFNTQYLLSVTVGAESDARLVETKPKTTDSLFTVATPSVTGIFANDTSVQGQTCLFNTVSGQLSLVTSAGDVVSGVPFTGRYEIWDGSTWVGAPANVFVVAPGQAVWPKLFYGDVGFKGSIASLTDWGSAGNVKDNDMPGGVLENRLVTRQISFGNVTLPNLIIRNCVFQPANLSVYPGFGSIKDWVGCTSQTVLIEDCTFIGTDGYQLMLGRCNADFIVRRCQFTDAISDNMKVTGGGGSVLVESCYVHGLGGHPNLDTDGDGQITSTPDIKHADGVQINRSTSQLTAFRGCTFDTAAWNVFSPNGYLANASWAHSGDQYQRVKDGRSIFWGDSNAAGPNQTGLVEYCYLDGSKSCVLSGSGNGVPAANIVVRYNTMGLGYTHVPFSGSMTKYGNRWEVSGTPPTYPGFASYSIQNGWTGPWVAGQLLPGESAGP